MKLCGPTTYEVGIDDKGDDTNTKRIISVKNCAGEETTFPLTVGQLKLYVVSCGGKPIYVGGTKQPFRRRLYYGLTAKGQKGYSGYLWRDHCRKVTIDIWNIDLDEKEDFKRMDCDPSMIRADNKERKREILLETLEAEVVLQIRNKFGHWPKYQSEIHFHQSQDSHRVAAKTIVDHY